MGILDGISKGFMVGERLVAYTLRSFSAAVVAGHRDRVLATHPRRC